MKDVCLSPAVTATKTISDLGAAQDSGPVSRLPF